MNIQTFKKDLLELLEPLSSKETENLLDSIKENLKSKKSVKKTKTDVKEISKLDIEYLRKLEMLKTSTTNKNQKGRY
jgi:hypothetical protein